MDLNILWVVFIGGGKVKNVGRASPKFSNLWELGSQKISSQCQLYDHILFMCRE